MSIHKKPKKVRTIIGQRLIDLLLIVISVYTALAVNSWANERNDRKRLQQYYRNFVSEVKLDIEDLNAAKVSAQKTIDNCTKQLQFIKTFSHIDSITEYMSQLFIIDSLFGQTKLASYKSMQISGDMKLINNIDLRKTLIELENTYSSVTFQENLFSNFITKDLMDFANNHFDLSKGLHAINPDVFKQIRYKNALVNIIGLSKGRIIVYDSALKSANNLMTILEEEKSNIRQ